MKGTIADHINDHLRKGVVLILHGHLIVLKVQLGDRAVSYLAYFRIAMILPGQFLLYGASCGLIMIYINDFPLLFPSVLRVVPAVRSVERWQWGRCM